jgi:tight adherence protein C
MNGLSTHWIVALFAVGVGLSGALVAWLVSEALSKVPAEDRQYKDPPPLGFRLVWWPVQWLSHFLGGFMPGKTYRAVMVRLRQAGLDYTINPPQYMAARLVCAAVVALVAYWALGSFEQAGKGFSRGAYVQAVVIGALCGWLYPAIWLRDRLQQRRRQLLRALPFYLDIVTLCVETGLNFQGAIHQAVDKGPHGVLRDELQRVLRDIRAGKARADALRAMAERLNEPSVASFVSAVIQAESMGMNLGPVLRAQADQRRTERFLRAEKLAMQAPVKMLFPLIAFIFPCTFIVLFFPIVMKFLHSGL